MSNILIFFPSNSTSGTLRTCVNMLGRYCTTGVEKKAARALTDFINYICTTQGQNGDVNLIIVYLFFYSIMLIGYREECADEIVIKIFSWLLSHISPYVFCFPVFTNLKLKQKMTEPLMNYSIEQ